MEYKKTFHSVYSLTYHIVFVTKYRKPVISNEIGDFMKERAAYLCERFRGELISAETDMDHVHLLVSLPPSAAPSVVVRRGAGTVYRSCKKISLRRRLSFLEQQLFYCYNRLRVDGNGKSIYRWTVY